MKPKTIINIFASEDAPVSQEAIKLVVDFVNRAKDNELSQTYFARANVEKITADSLILKVTEYPGCYDVIFGPYPTAKFIVPQSKEFNNFLIAISNLLNKEN